MLKVCSGGMGISRVWGGETGVCECVGPYLMLRVQAGMRVCVIIKMRGSVRVVGGGEGSWVM